MDKDAEKILNGLEWCIKADNARQCVYALTECPYVEDCRKYGKKVLLEDAYILIRRLLNKVGNNVKTDIFCGNCGKKVTILFCDCCGRMVNWGNDKRRGPSFTTTVQE